MNIIKNTQKGFVIPLVLAIVAVLVAGGLFYWNLRNQTANDVSPQERADQYNRSIQLSKQIEFSQLLNAKIPDPFNGGTTTLVNGHYQGVYSGAGKANSDISVDIKLATASTSYAIGDINGDDVSDIAAITVTNTGGTGQFYALAVFVNQNGEPKYITSKGLGDRSIINNISINNEVITVDFLTQGPGDGMCCASLRKVVSYQLTGDSLVEVPVVTTTNQVTNKRVGIVTDNWQVYDITDLGLKFTLPDSLSDLIHTAYHLSGDQAVNSVAFSSKRLENAGCATGTLGFLTYDNDKGGTVVAHARGSDLYYIKSSLQCSIMSYEQNQQVLQNALKSLVTDYGVPSTQTTTSPSVLKCSNGSTNYPHCNADGPFPTAIISSITPASGPVGTTVEIVGTNLAGLEGELDAYIQNVAGETAFLPGIGLVPRADQMIKIKIDAQLCKQNNSYSGAPCTSYMNIVPGVYKIFTQPWGKMSNLVPFTVTEGSIQDKQTYSNPEYGISFQYPVGSKVSDIDITGGRELDINNIDGTMTSIRIQDSRLVPNYSPIQTPCNDNGYYTSGTLDTYNDIDFVKSDVSNTYGGMQSAAYAESYCVVNGGTNYTITPRISWNRYSGSERNGPSQNSAPVTPPDKTTSFDTFDQVMSDLEFTFTN